MSRTTLNLIIEGAIVTTIVSAFVLTTATSAKPAPPDLATQPMSISQTDRLAVPNTAAPRFPIARICIGRHANLLCGSAGGTADNLGATVPLNSRNAFQSWVVQPESPTKEFVIPGNVMFFSGNSMDPHAIGAKVNLLDLR
jgi:hypothetical protein